MFLFIQRAFSSITRPVFFPAIIFLLWVSLLAGGCVQQTAVYPDLPSQKNHRTDSGTLDNDDIFSAVAQIDLVTNNGRYPVRAALMIMRPSYLRLELLPVIGTPDFMLAASPEKMSIFIPSQGKFYYGQPTAANLGKFLPWKFNIEDIVMIFSGAYPSFKENNISYQSYREENILRMEMKAPSGSSQMIWMGEDNKLHKLVRRDETGKEVYTVRYLYDATGGSFPETIKISMADGITSLSIKYSDVKVEKSNDLSIFNLSLPDNVKAIRLE
jgi:hypothetical protein